MFAAPLVVNAAPTAQAVARAGTWHTATNVPGLRALNKGGRARLNSVSCGAAGDCAAGGSYRDNHGRTRAFVISLTNGTWDPAVEVPGLATLNAGGNASADSVSCVSAGNCTAVGDYTDGFGHPQPVAVREKNGIWGQAIQLPGPGLFDADAGANVISVSCASAGTLRHWRVLHRRLQARAGVRSERGERCLGNAVEVPGSGTLNAGDASVTSVSCRSAESAPSAGPTPTAPVTPRRSWSTRPSGRLMRCRRGPSPAR